MATKQADTRNENLAAKETPRKEERPRRDLASWFKLGDWTGRNAEEWALA